MNSGPQEVKTRLMALNGDLYEDGCLIRLDHFACRTAAELEDLRSIAVYCKDSDFGKFVIAGEILRDFDLQQISLEIIQADTLSLVIEKKKIEGSYSFLTLGGLTQALSDSDFVREARTAHIAEDFSPFASLTCAFTPWNVDLNLTEYPWNGLTDPRKLVRDLSLRTELRVPADIRPWLLRTNQHLADSAVLQAWKTVAACKLALVLPSEVRSSDQADLALFKGEKLREVQIADFAAANPGTIFTTLHDCADWIYTSQQDAEIKHTLLNYHLAFEWIGNEEWPDKTFLERALVSARESFKLHLQEAGKELLKAYGEIKKALHDDVDKVAENTRGLVTNLWRDFAVAGSVVVIKFLTSNDLTPAGIRLLYISTSAFLLLSLVITVLTNARFNQIAEDDRTRWYARLYPFIDQDSLDELVNKPISDGLNTYGWVVYATMIMYVVMTGYLLYVALSAA